MYVCMYIISYQLFWSMLKLISRNQRAVSSAQPRVIQPAYCEICVVSYSETVENKFIS